MNAVQVIGAFVILAGIVWVFAYPLATGNTEVGWSKFTAKGLTQGLGIVLVGAALVYFGRDKPNPPSSRVADAGMRADDSSYFYCPPEVSFTGYIDLEGNSGTVRYRFLRHGARAEEERSAIQTLQFDSTGQEPIQDKWSPLYLAGLPHLTTLSDQVEVLQPNQVTSDPAEITIPQTC
jgi:hypothetical protein